MSTSVVAADKPVCPNVHNSLLPLLGNAMNTSPDRNLDVVECWIEKAVAYMTALMDMRRDGCIPDFVAAQFYIDIENVIKTVYRESDRSQWTEGQSGLTFAISNFRNVFKVY